MSIRSAAMLTLTITGAAAAGPSVLCDDFEDGRIDPGWSVLRSEPGLTAPVEQNGHLEFPSPGGGDDVFAGLVSLWTLDTTQDFQIKVDYAALPPAAGEIGFSFAVVFSGDIAQGEIIDGFVLDIGYEPEGPFSCVTLFLGGLEFFVCNVPTGAGTTMYMWYDATADQLYGSYIGFDDPTANSGTQLRQSSRADRAQVALIGFVAQNPPAIPGSDQYLDDFCVESGRVIPSSIPGDVDNDGNVGFFDLTELLNAWGPCPGCAADITGDGSVGFEDLIILLANWTA